jgi:hypothetical protein
LTVKNDFFQASKSHTGQHPTSGPFVIKVSSRKRKLHLIWQGNLIYLHQI